MNHADCTNDIFIRAIPTVDEMVTWLDQPDPTGGGGCGPTSPPGAFVISSSPDDAEQSLSTGNVTLAGVGLELGQQTNGTPNAVFLRFPNLTVPQGATCTNAYLAFQATDLATHSSGSPTFAIRTVQSANVAPMQNVGFGISSLGLDTEEVNWSPAAWTPNTLGPETTTPNLCAVLQDRFSDPAWASGANALGFVIVHDSGSAGYRIAKSVDGGGITYLVVEYTPASGGTPVLSVGAWQVARADAPQDINHWMAGLNTPVAMPSPSCVDVRMRVGVTGGNIGPLVLSPTWRQDGSGSYVPLVADPLQGLFLGRNLQIPNGTATTNLFSTPGFVPGWYMTSTPGEAFKAVTLTAGQSTELVTTACLKGGMTPPTYFELCLSRMTCPDPPRINVGSGVNGVKLVESHVLLDR